MSIRFFILLILEKNILPFRYTDGDGKVFEKILRGYDQRLCDIYDEKGSVRGGF
jgi:hypothetical protein